NATTNISREMISPHCPHFQKLTVKLGRTVIRSLATQYSEVSPCKAGAIINSWDALEIFKREGHAARSLKLKLGRKIQIIPDS
ncbi:MAG: SAM hydroxide adenosyltransferase, partial [Nitrospinaceae bacterium]